MSAAIEIKTNRISLGIENRPFTDVWIHDVRIDRSGLHAGQMKVREWPRGEINRFHRRTKRYEALGRPLVLAAEQLGRSITGGWVGALSRRFDVPVVKPADRSLVAQDCSVSDAPVGVWLEGRR